MLKRILLVWIIANFALAGIFALLTGSWYIRLPAFVGMIAELGLITVPNLLFPILLLRYGWPVTVSDLRQELGWEWKGWRPIYIGVIAFVIYLLLSTFSSEYLGPSIPYNLPGGEGGSISSLAGLLALLYFIVFVVITVVGEETMFRGLIQTQTSQYYGVCFDGLNASDSLLH
ncbi:MAG TPA: hypothetical protein VF355_05650 [Anaerolineaceae bacterium]